MFLILNEIDINNEDGNWSKRSACGFPWLCTSLILSNEKTCFIYMEKLFLPGMLLVWIRLHDGEKTEWESV